MPRLYEELVPVMDELGPCELVFVDDGSTDGTVEELRSICKQDPRVKTVVFSRNQGQTAALQAGFDHASAPVVVTLDGDLQNDPADIPRLLAVDGRGLRRGLWMAQEEDGHAAVPAAALGGGQPS